ncbi:MAG TPA: hypothetical protein VF502_02075 [Stellaceae bacterium]
MAGSRLDLSTGSPSGTVSRPTALRPLGGWAKPRATIDDRVALFSLISLGIVFAIILVTTIRSPLKDDIAWLLHVAQDVLRGKRLYVDDIEVNPPLIVWILMLPAEFARLTGLSAPVLADLFFAGTALGSAFWSAWLLRDYSAVFDNRAAVFAAIGAVLLIVPGVEFGQREHLLAVFALPYLCLFAQRLRHQHPSTAHALGCGAVAAVGCALKPHYAMAFAGLEALAATRGVRVWRAETVCALVLLVGYAAAVAVFFPVYFSFIVPFARDLYGASDAPFGMLLLQSHNLLLGQSIVLLLCLTRVGGTRGDPLLLALAVFGCGTIAACFIEQKDWFYHRLPATTVVVLAIAYWIAGVFVDHTASGRRKLAGLAVAACALGAFGGAAADRLTPRVEFALGESAPLESRIEDLVKRSGATRYMAFSQSLSPGFPVVDEAGAVWTSRFDSMWALRSVVWHLRNRRGTLPWPVKRWVVTDFVRGCPELVVVDDRDDVDYITVLSASPQFAAAWSNYRQTAAFDGIRVFALTAGHVISAAAAHAPALARPSDSFGLDCGARCVPCQ